MIKAYINLAEHGSAWQNTHDYLRGDVVNHSGNYFSIVCIKNGTSGASEPDLSGLKRLDTITSGTAEFVILLRTIILSDIGITIGSEYFHNAIKNFSLTFSADPIDRVSGGTIEFERLHSGLIYVQNIIEFSIIIYDDDSLEFSGKATRNGRGDTFTYQLKTINIQVDTNSSDSYGTIPRVFGAVKYVTPQLIDAANQVYRVGYGKPVKVYDNGQSIKTTIYAAGDNVFGKTYPYEVFVPQYKILGTITVDAISGNYGSSQSINISDFAIYTIEYDDIPGVEGVDKPYKQADVTGDRMDAGVNVTGTDGGIRAGKVSYADDINAGWFIGRDGGVPRVNIGGPNFSFKWDGAGLIVQGLFQTYNQDKTRMTLVGGKIYNGYLTTRYPLSTHIIYNGLTYNYYWTGTTWKQGISHGVPLANTFAYNGDRTILESYLLDLTGTTVRYPTISDFTSSSLRNTYQWNGSSWVNIQSIVYDISDEYNFTSKFESFTIGGKGITGRAYEVSAGAVDSTGVLGLANSGVGVKGESISGFGGKFNGGTGIATYLHGLAGHLFFSSVALPGGAAPTSGTFIRTNINGFFSSDGSEWQGIDTIQNDSVINAGKKIKRKMLEFNFADTVLFSSLSHGIANAHSQKRIISIGVFEVSGTGSVFSFDSTRSDSVRYITIGDTGIDIYRWSGTGAKTMRVVLEYV